MMENEMVREINILVTLLLGSNLAYVTAQSLSEDKGVNTLYQQENTDDEGGYELNGYVRGDFFGWKSSTDRKAEMKSGYGEIALALKAKKKDWGNGYAEIRIREGNEYGSKLFEIGLREAYVNASLGPLDLRVGQQIIAWGKADGINPTNIITPQNYMVRSPNFDDRREGNLAIRSWLQWSLFRLETIWVPFYKFSLPPFDFIQYPMGIAFLDSAAYPDHHIENSAVALRLHFECSDFDGSVSYYNGFNPLPALNGLVGISGIQFFPVAYRTSMIGADFSTTAGEWGIRGEGAYKFCMEEYSESVYLPSPEFQYVFGMDRSIGNVTFIVQYIGKYVPDFQELIKPADPLQIPAFEITKANRMFAMQQDKVSHSLSATVNWSMFYETLKLELRSVYHFTSKEYLVNPIVSYELTDAMKVSIGANYYRGPEGTLFDITDDLFSDVFLEFKVAF
jgi:hypothetical protein